MLGRVLFHTSVPTQEFTTQDHSCAYLHAKNLFPGWKKSWTGNLQYKDSLHMEKLQ